MKKMAIVLAAGKGTRMKSELPKVAHEVLYKPMISHVVDVLKEMDFDRIVVVVGHKAEVVQGILKDSVEYVWQNEQLGTGHAVMMAKDLLSNEEGVTFVLCGDAPLVRKETLEGLLTIHEEAGNKATLMSANCDTSKAYGRILRNETGVLGIREFKDCTPEQKMITEMNCGEYAFDNQALFESLDLITNDNAAHEYYLTDVIQILGSKGEKVGSYVIDDFNEVGGINSKLDLAEANKMLQRRINREHLINGVTIIDPENTYIARDVKIGPDTVIEPGCILKGNTVIGKNCHIGPYCEFNNVTLADDVEVKFSVLSDTVVDSGTDIGPYARFRNNCHLHEHVHVGNFVEMKNADFGVGSKCAHLSYIGDASVGNNVNIGCGTITSNYDGKNKFRTTIGNNVFVGCNSNLVAPVTLEDDAYVAAGSTITKDVPSWTFAIARERQVNKEDYAKVLKEKRENIKK